MFGFASGANCPTAQTSVPERPETDARELSPVSALGLSTCVQSPAQAGPASDSAPDTCPVGSSLDPHAAVPKANTPIPMTKLLVLMVRLLPSLHSEEWSHGGDVGGVAGLFETSEPERLLKGLEQRVVVVRSRVLQPAG